MPELPDVTIYIEALERRIAGQTLQRVRLANPFVLRTVEPSIADVSGKKVIGVRRAGKRIVIALESDLFIVIHLMIAGSRRTRRFRGSSASPRSTSSMERCC
jgi:formamidopyrimidine-DNA glycosylase